MSLSKLERETVITMNDGEDWAEVYTAQRPVITRLRKNPAAELVDDGVFETTAWAKYRLPKQLVSFRTKTVKRAYTADERAERAARLRRATR